GRDHAGAAPGHQRRALGVGEEAGRDLDVAQLRREPTVPGGRHRHLSRSPSHRSRTRGELTRVGPGTRAPPAFGYPAVWGRSGETMAFLDAELKEQVRQVLSPLQEEVELVVYRGSGLIVPGRDQPGEERAMLELAREVAETSDKVSVVERFLAGDEAAAEAGITLTPTTVFRRKGSDSLNVRFAGLMSGYEFSTMLETILLVGGVHELEGLDEVRAIGVPLRLRTFVTPTCPYCPRAVITAFRFALSNPSITAEAIEANEFPT